MTGDDDKKEENKEILEQTVLDELEQQAPEPEKTLEDILREKKAQEKKKRTKRIIIFCIVAFLSYVLYWGFKPFKGTLPYGICKTFLELNILYPQTLRISEVTYLREDNSVRIWFAHTDAFGEYRMENFKCSFGPDPKSGSGTVLTRVERNRMEIDPAKVELFNNAIPYLVANPPDLTMPPKIPDSLQNMQIETQRFRKPIF